MIDKRIVNAFAIVILLAWASSFILDAFLVKYDPPASVHALMMLVAGSTFGVAAFKKGADNDK